MGAIVTTDPGDLNTTPARAPRDLLLRLEAIAASLRASGQALALIGLGSVGQDTARLDAWSDLDFFAIVEPGTKGRYLNNLDWLAAAHPLAWHFQNTVDGHKALMADGVFCEFAVFEPLELAHIPFAPGRVVWKRESVDDDIALPRKPLPAPAPPGEEWIVGEALSFSPRCQRCRPTNRQLSASPMIQSSPGGVAGGKGLRGTAMASSMRSRFHTTRPGAKGMLSSSCGSNTANSQNTPSAISALWPSAVFLKCQASGCAAASQSRFEM